MQAHCVCVVLQTGRFTTPAKYDSARTQFEVEVRKIFAFGQSAQTKIGCVKSFAVKCAHKCNLLRTNATFVEHKCNFLTFLLQQKLALVIKCCVPFIWITKKSILVLLNTRQVLEIAFLINWTSCLWQLTVDTLSPGNAHCERGFSTINNITVQTIEKSDNYKQCRQLALYQYSAPWDLRAIHTSKHGLEKEELTQQVAWRAKSKRKEDNYYEPLCRALK